MKVQPSQWTQWEFSRIGLERVRQLLARIVGWDTALSEGKDDEYVVLHSQQLEDQRREFQHILNDPTAIDHQIVAKMISSSSYSSPPVPSVCQGSESQVQEDPTALFTVTLQEFHTRLPESARRSFCQYGSSTDMLAAVKAECQLHKQFSRLSSCTTKIAIFSDTFAPFFDVIGIFVQIKPEWLGIFWGSVRLVLVGLTRSWSKKV